MRRICGLLGIAALLLTGLMVPAGAAVTDRYFNLTGAPQSDIGAIANYDNVSPIRNQGEYGICWTFAALASYESNWRRQMTEAGLTVGANTVDFSERYLAWMTGADLTVDPTTWAHFPLDYDVEVPEGYPERYRIYNTGGNDNRAYPFMIPARFGVVNESIYPYDPDPRGHQMQGIPSLVPVSGLVHDVLNLVDNGDLTYYYKDESTRNLVKRLISEFGAATAVFNVSDDVMDETTAEIYNPDFVDTNHVVSIVGWDDDYEFTSTTIGHPTSKGAWIMRNSWGTDAGLNGYYYISYEDATMVNPAAYVAELDYLRYTRTDYHSPFGLDLYLPTGLNQASFASRYTASTSQFVKAVGFFVEKDSTSYTIEIRTKSDGPDQGRLVYTQSGTFGLDGTTELNGYRTVDLNSFVFVPYGENYTVTITLRNKDGSEVAVPKAYTPTLVMPTGVSYVIDEGNWLDVTIFDTHSSLAMYSQAKDSSLPNGGDFTVVSLDDGGRGGSVIDLGRAGELYLADALHPDRTTLSDMIVHLTTGISDSIYGGVIFGQGGLIKTGTGRLTLTGANLYTGGSTVTEGGFWVNGSILGDVLLGGAGTLGGSGAIGGSVTSSGVIAPGNSIGTLNIAGDLTLTPASRLEIEVDGQGGHDTIVVGGTAIRDGNLTLTPVRSYFGGRVSFNADDFIQAQTLFGSLNADVLNILQTNILSLNWVNGGGGVYTLVPVRAANAYSRYADSILGLGAGQGLDAIAGKNVTAMSGLFSLLDWADGSLIGQALPQLGPGAYQAAAQVALDSGHMLAASVLETLFASYAAKRTSSGDGPSSSAFLMPLGNIQAQSSRPDLFGYDASESGLLGGYQRRFGEEFTGGVHAAFTHREIKIKTASRSRANIESLSAGVHGLLRPDAWKGSFIYGLAQAGLENGHMDRSVAFDGYKASLDADWTGMTTAFNIGAGHDFRSQGFSFTPLAGLHYGLLRQPGISEVGDAVALKISPATYHTLRSSLGARVGYAGTGLGLGLSAQWQHELLDAKLTTRAGYRESSGDTFLTSSRLPGRDSLHLRLDASLSLRQDLILGMQVGSDIQRPGFADLGGLLDLRWRF